MTTKCELKQGDYVNIATLSPREQREVALAFEAAGGKLDKSCVAGWPYEKNPEGWTMLGWGLPDSVITRARKVNPFFDRTLTYADAVGYVPGEGEVFQAMIDGEWRSFECTAVGEEWLLAREEEAPHPEMVLKRERSMRPDAALAFEVDLKHATKQVGSGRKRAELMIEKGWSKKN